MNERSAVIVVGGGAIGSSAAWHLARRGVDVTLVERFEPGHHRGASHGATRNFNVAYREPEYQAMLRESLELWRDLEAESGATLLSLHGLVNHGGAFDVDARHRAMLDAGWRSEMLDATEASSRWTGMRFASDVQFTADGGTVRADLAVAALQAGVVASGGRVIHNTEVVAIREHSSGVEVDLVDADGRRTLTADAVVVAVGAWTSGLLGGLVRLPVLRVTQEQPSHFAPRDAASLDSGTVWPSFNHHASQAEGGGWWPAAIYGMPTPGEGIKIGWHGAGPVVDPEGRDFLPDSAVQADLRRYASEWFPGVDPDSAVPVSCTYTWTADEDFIIDRVGRVVVGAGFSGHGFKFVPAVGRALADLAVGEHGTAERFRLERFSTR